MPPPEVLTRIYRGDGHNAWRMAGTLMRLDMPSVHVDLLRWLPWPFLATVAIALPRTAPTPRLNHPPLAVFRFSSASLCVGIETRHVDGVVLQIYSREKTLADVFKYRHKLGLDVAIEALRSYRSQPKPDWQRMLAHARICRVRKCDAPLSAYRDVKPCGTNIAADHTSSVDGAFPRFVRCSSH